MTAVRPSPGGARPLVGIFAGVGNRITGADDAFVSMLGYDRERFEADRRAGVPLSPGWEAVDEAALARASSQRGMSDPYEKRFRCADGTDLPVLVSFSVEPDHPDRWVGYAVDLTPRPGHRPMGDADRGDRTSSGAYERVIGELVHDRHRIGAMLDATHDLIWSVDRDLRLRGANRAFADTVEEAVGWAPALGDPVLDAGFADDELVAWEELYRRALGGEDFTHRYGGPRGWSDLRFAPIRDLHGEIVGATIVATDVTESVMARRALEQRERLLSIAVRLGRVAAWRIDATNQQVTVSDELIETFELSGRPGYTLDEAFMLYPEQQRSTIALEVERCLRDGTPIDREILLDRGPGHRRWVRVLAEAERGADGSVVAIDGAITDVTEEHERSAKLREQASLLDNASDAILVRDLDGIVTYWNRAAEDLYGWTAAEAIGHHISDLVDGGDRAKFERVEEQLHAHGEWSGRLDNTDRDGEPLTIELHLNMITDESGRPVALLSISRDVSEQVALEQRLAQSQKLDAIGQLAGGVAHDFNNLLTVISGGAELLREMVTDDHEAVSLVEMMLAAAIRGGDLTQRLLASARRQPLRPELVDPGRAIEQSLQLLRRSLPEAIDIVTSSPATVWPISVDPAQFEAAILNIALNARDAMDGAGRLTIVIDHVSIDEGATHDDVPAGDYVRISITDVGHGMDEQDRARAFEPFFTTKPVGKGSGLGLSMVHGFVRQSGGGASLISSPGAGTTVVLLFPRAGDRASDDLGGGDVARLPRGHERLLVVEDDPLVSAQTVATLRRLGYHVEAVVDGPAALARLEVADPPIDLVFSDVVMPGGLDGVELSLEIARRWPHLPVILTSGYHEDHHRPVPPELTFLAKPYRRSVVARAIRRALERSRRS